MLAIAWRAQAARRLEAAGSPDPMADARLLSWGDSLRELSPREEARLDALLARRLAGEPVQYVLESAWFMGLEFSVDRRVLIPRQDTETLCEAALAFLRDRESPRALDLCAGSGAIGLSLAKLCPQREGHARGRERGRLRGDRLKTAAGWAWRRRSSTGDLFAPARGAAFSTSSPAIPPISARGNWIRLQAEVQREPRLALDGGADGLAFYRRIAAEYAKSPRRRAGRCFWRSAGTKRKTCARCLAAGACCAT